MKKQFTQKFKVLFLFTTLMLISLTSCTPTPSIITDNKSIELKFGETFNIIATKHSADDFNIKWESQSPDIATVDENGVVTGIKQGTTSIEVFLSNNDTSLPEPKLKDSNILVTATVLDNPELTAKLEAERIEKEQAEVQRLEQEKIAKEQAEAQRLEQERIAKEQAEAQRLEQERIAKENANAQRVAQEKAAAVKASKPAPQKPSVSAPSNNTTTSGYVANLSTKKFHRSSCHEINKMNESNKGFYSSDQYQTIINKGFVGCKKCSP